MGREYFIAETLEAADQAVSVLHHQLHITDKHIHLVSHNENGLRQHHLHAASIIQKSDVIRRLEHGAFYGLFFSLIGFCMVAFAAPWWELGSSYTGIILSVLVAPLIAGGGIGACIGLRNECYKINRFHQDLENGCHLILVDSDQLAPIKEALKNCPVVDKGSDHTLIYPFDEPISYEVGVSSAA